MKKVIEILEKNSSMCIPSFLKLVNDVDTARKECTEIVRFLKPLKKIFQKMKYDSTGMIEFTELHQVFKKLFHFIYLIWTKSKYYNTPTRLVCLIREICNDLIERVNIFVFKY